MRLRLGCGLLLALLGMGCSDRPLHLPEVPLDLGIARQPDLAVAGPLSELDSPVTTNLNAIWGSSKDDIFIVGDGATILHSADDGRTWETQRPPVSSDLLAVWGSGPRDVFVVGSEGTVVHSIDGSTWSPVTIPTDEFPPNVAWLDGIWGSGGGDIFISGQFPGVLHSADGGASFSFQPANVEGGNPYARMTAVWGSSADDVYVVGDSSIMHSVDRGATWSVMTIGDYGSPGLEAVWGSGLDDVYAVGTASALGLDAPIFHTTDRGRTWTLQTPCVGNPTCDVTFDAVWGSSPDDVYVAGWTPLEHSADRGNSWQSIMPSEFAAIHGIWGAGPNDVFFVGEHGTILHHS